MHVKKKFYYKPMLCRKVKTILVIMGICCFPMISWAQVFLSGRIVDKKTNEPVVGASVYIRKNQVGDNANDNGLYRIKLPQNGTYLVEVSFIGYKTQEVPVAGKKEIQLKISFWKKVQKC